MAFDPRLVFVIAPGLEEARGLARLILEKRLAACVNIVPGIESHYWWQGKLETSGEVLLLIKSSAEQFEALAEIIRRAPFLRMSGDRRGRAGGNRPRLPRLVGGRRQMPIRGRSTFRLTPLGRAALRSLPFMAEELSYVIINPYTIYKSRTGGVLARLLTRTSLDLVGAQMFAPSQALIDEYAQNIVTEADPQDRHIQELIRDYVKENLAPDPGHRPARARDDAAFPRRERRAPHPRNGRHLQGEFPRRRIDPRHLRRHRPQPRRLGALLRAGRARLAQSSRKRAPSSRSGPSTAIPTAACWRRWSAPVPIRATSGRWSSSSPTISSSPADGPATSSIFFPAPAWPSPASRCTG